LEKLAREPNAVEEARLKGIAQEIAELEQQEKDFKAKEEEIERMEREHPHFD